MGRSGASIAMTMIPTKSYTLMLDECVEAFKAKRISPKRILTPSEKELLRGKIAALKHAAPEAIHGSQEV
jgi:hypothetical protein